jgi:hypothetical protein
MPWAACSLLMAGADNGSGGAGRCNGHVAAEELISVAMAMPAKRKFMSGGETKYTQIVAIKVSVSLRMGSRRYRKYVNRRKETA